MWIFVAIFEYLKDVFEHFALLIPINEICFSQRPAIKHSFHIYFFSDASSVIQQAVFTSCFFSTKGSLTRGGGSNFNSFLDQ